MLILLLNVLATIGIYKCACWIADKIRQREFRKFEVWLHNHLNKMGPQ